MNGLQSLPQWQNDFNHPGSAMLGLLNAIQNIGTLAGLPFSPYFADGLGRRAAVLFGAGIMVGPPPTTFPLKELVANYLWVPTGCRYCYSNRLPERWDVRWRSFPHRFRSHLRPNWCRHVGHRIVVPLLPRSFDLPLQLPLVLRCYCCRMEYLRYLQAQFLLGLENSVRPPGCSLRPPTLFPLVRPRIPSLVY